MNTYSINTAKSIDTLIVKLHRLRSAICDNGLAKDIKIVKEEKVMKLVMGTCGLILEIENELK